MLPSKKFPVLSPILGKHNYRNLIPPGYENPKKKNVLRCILLKNCKIGIGIGSKSQQKMKYFLLITLYFLKTSLKWYLILKRFAIFTQLLLILRWHCAKQLLKFSSCWICKCTEQLQLMKTTDLMTDWRTDEKSLSRRSS